eukprot:s1817_g7.t2
MSVPPLIRCCGVRSPHAKAINGIYEYIGAHSGRPCYRQTGVSSGNFVWYCQDALEGSMWVITQNESRPGEAPETAVARAMHLGRWPWEVTGWQVCGRNDAFLEQPKMAFSLMLPAAELIVQAPALDSAVSTCGFRRSGFVHDRVAFRRTGDTDDPGITSLWIFWMPKQGRWLLANVKPGGSGVQSVVARSIPDDGSTWACFWPWEVEAEGWESPTADTIGLEDADAIWVPNRDIAVRLASPGIGIPGGDLRRISVKLGAVQLSAAFEEIQLAVCEGFGLGEQEVTLKYEDEEGDLCTLTPLTIEDFLLRPISCSEEFHTPPKVLLSLRGDRGDCGALETSETSRLALQSCHRVATGSGSRPAQYFSGGFKSKMSGDQNLSLEPPGRAAETGTLSGTSSTAGVLPLLRSLGPVALLACLKGLHGSGRLTPEILASLMLQFLPIFAQRVQRKVEKMNRKGLKMRQDKNFKPLMQFIKRLCIHFQEIPETRNVRDDLQNYLAGSEAARLGDTLAELLRCLVACNSRSTLASALLADILRVVLPCVFPESFQETGPCCEWAAIILGAPVHGGIACALCRQQNIVGPRFEGQQKHGEGGRSLCGHCFLKETVKGKADDSSYTCRLAPAGYDAEAALGDINSNSLPMAALLAMKYQPLDPLVSAPSVPSQIRPGNMELVIGTVEDHGAPPVIICGFYEPRGMANGRVYYVMVPEDISLEKSTGPMCLWFAEDGDCSQIWIGRDGPPLYMVVLLGLKRILVFLWQYAPWFVQFLANLIQSSCHL